MDNNKLNEFVKKNYKRHLKFLERALYHSILEAEDVLQESYCKAIQSLDKYDSDKSSFNTYFNYIMFNTLRSMKRRIKNDIRSEVNIDLIVDEYDPKHFHIGDAIQSYNKSDRVERILYLFYMLGYKSADIAFIEGINVSSITTICNRFKTFVKEKLNEV